MNTAVNNRKVVIIGAGKVGASVAYTVMMNNLTSEVVLIDVDREKANGEALDICHGIAYLRQVIVRDGDYADCTDAGIIVITAGIPRQPGQSRLDLANVNISVTCDIVQKIMQYAQNPIIIVISNPVDVLTYIVQKESGLPASRVIGSGTALDTGRFRYLLSRQCDVDVRSVNAYIVGEHGDNGVPVWSQASIGTKSLDEYCQDDHKKCPQTIKEQIFEQTRVAGAEIIKKKGATFYGVALAAASIVGAIIGDENATFTVSSTLDGQYGINDVALSLPCIINKNGIERYDDIRMDKAELQKFKDAADKLKNVLCELYIPYGANHVYAE